MPGGRLIESRSLWAWFPAMLAARKRNPSFHIFYLLARDCSARRAVNRLASERKSAVASVSQC